MGLPQPRPVRPRSRSLFVTVGIAVLALPLALAFPVLAARPRVYAIQGARIVTAPGKTIASGTIVLRNGTIESVGADVKPPADAEIVEGKGLTVYAGLIDPFTHLGMPKIGGEGETAGPGGGAAPARGREPRAAEKPAERGPGRSNLQIRSDTRAALLYQAPPATDLDKMHRLGFTSALAVPDGGVFRGTSALVHLGGDDPARAILVPDIAAHLAFETAPGDVYPTSLMGVIALIRQTFEDAKRQSLWTERWKKNPRGLERPPLSPTLEAAGDMLSGRRRVIFEVDDTHAYARVAALAREYGFTPVIVGRGFEYEVEGLVRSAGFPSIVPVAFPDPPHLEDEDAALDVTTRDLRRWDLAPGNPSVIQKTGIPFALTTFRLRNVSDFAKNVRTAIERGLPPDAALEAVTTAPARLLGVETMLGTIETGKIADLVLADGDLFGEKTQIKKLFVDGDPVEIEAESKDFDPNAKIDPRGTWEVTYSFRDQAMTRIWKIEGAPGSYTGTAETQTGKASLENLALTGNKLTGTYTVGGAGTVEFTWIIKGDEMSGTSTTPGGRKISYSGRRTAGPGTGGAL